MQARIAPSLGEGFAGTPNKVWGTTPYTSEEEPTVFFGLYGLPDFFALWRHKGKKYILWAGSDITHFIRGYWLSDNGSIRLHPEPLAEWIDKNCESYVENELERVELARAGIEARVVPSFLGNVEDFEPCFTPGKPRFYTSVSGDDFELYGWEEIEFLSDDFPDVEFHLYGNTKPWYTDKPNIFVHGRVSQEEMDAEIKQMTGALRLTRHDGFSEILAKSLLWEQWPVSPHIDYPNIATSIKEVMKKRKPNTKGRRELLKIVNKYPWNDKNNKTTKELLEEEKDRLERSVPINR